MVQNVLVIPVVVLGLLGFATTKEGKCIDRLAKS